MTVPRRGACVPATLIVSSRCGHGPLDRPAHERTYTRSVLAHEVLHGYLPFFNSGACLLFARQLLLLLIAMQLLIPCITMVESIPHVSILSLTAPLLCGSGLVLRSA